MVLVKNRKVDQHNRLEKEESETILITPTGKAESTNYLGGNWAAVWQKVSLD